MLHSKRPKLAVLHSHEVSRETVQALEYLLREARAGNIRGAAFVVMHHGVDYTTGVVGAFKTVRPIARGMVLELYDEVSGRKEPH